MTVHRLDASIGADIELSTDFDEEKLVEDISVNDSQDLKESQTAENGMEKVDIDIDMGSTHSTEKNQILLITLSLMELSSRRQTS